MTTKAPAKPANAQMSLSPDARARLRHTESPRSYYYNDQGGSKGNCTWGVGIKVHNGPCSAEELIRKVSAAEIESSFSSKVGEAERGVRRQVPDQLLTQAQFDALVSVVYNTGVAGAVNVFALVNDGKLKETGALIASMIKARVKGKDGKKRYVVLRGLITRRAEEAKPFLAADK